MNSEKNITTLIFDLGGVLVNLDWDRCVGNFERIGIPTMKEMLSTTLQKDFVLKYEKGEIDTEQFRNELRKIAVKDVTDEELDMAWESLLLDIPKHKLRTLKELKKKYRILMLSNTNPLSFDYCLNHIFNVDGNGIDDYFDTCYLSYKMGMHKPNKDIFLKLLADANLTAEECLFLDDGVKNIKIAEELGFRTQLIEANSDKNLLELIQIQL